MISRAAPAAAPEVDALLRSSIQLRTLADWASNAADPSAFSLAALELVANGSDPGRRAEAKALLDMNRRSDAA